MPTHNHQSDPAHLGTELILARLERRITEEYSLAAREVEKTLKRYLQAFETKSETNILYINSPKAKYNNNYKVKTKNETNILTYT